MFQNIRNVDVEYSYTGGACVQGLKWYPPRDISEATILVFDRGFPPPVF